MDEEFEIIKSLEIELSLSYIRKDTARLSALLSDDFEEIGKSGKTYSKAEIIDALSSEEPYETELTDFTFKKLSNEIVLVKYKSSCNGINVHRSSIWVKTDGEWQMLHHQGTQCD